MKILIINNIFPPGFIGGYELGAFDIAKALQSLGHEIKVLTSAYFVEKHDHQIELNVDRSLICTSISHENKPRDPIENGYYNFHNIRMISNLLRKFRPNVVIAFNLTGLGAPSIIKLIQATKTPLIIYLMDNIFHGIDKSSSLYSLYKSYFGPIQFSNSTYFIAMSKQVVRETQTTIDSDILNPTIIPGWIDLSVLQNAKLPYSRKKHTKFVFCSRITPHKGIDILISAVQRLSPSLQDDLVIDIYGDGLVSDYMNQIQSLGLSNIIHYKGSLPKELMIPTLSQYDALVFPTWEREPFGFIACEAAASGAIPIMTAGIGAGDWFLDGINCFKIARTPEALRSAMQHIMLLDNNTLSKMKNTTQNHATKTFDFDVWMSIIEKKCHNISLLHPVEISSTGISQIESSLFVLGSLMREDSCHT